MIIIVIYQFSLPNLYISLLEVLGSEISHKYLRLVRVDDYLDDYLA